MIFLNPSILVGLSAAAVPLIIHLLAKARLSHIEWGAMMFLADAGPRNHAQRLKGPALLALRMIWVALLAMALAQPIIGRPRNLPADSRVCAVILLDASAPMAMEENGRTRFDLAKDAVYDILGTPLSGLRQRGDQVKLIPLGWPQAETVPPSLPAAVEMDEAQALAARVQGLSAPAGQADIARGLREALDFLDRCPAARREIYLVCGREAQSFSGLDPAFAAEFRRRLARWPAPPGFFVIPLGPDSTDNLSITGLEGVDPPAIADQPAQVEIRLHNFSSIPRFGLGLDVWTNSGISYAPHKTHLTVNAPAQSSLNLRSAVAWNESGSHLLRAELEAAPGVRFGLRMDRAVDVLDTPRVLIVSGDPRERSYRASADFLRLALAPYRSPRRDPVRVDTLWDAQWTPQDLEGHQLAIMANVPEFSPAQAWTLRAFVHDGGGLWIVPGDLSQVDNYNDLLGRAGVDLLGGHLGTELGDAPAATSLDHFQVDYPVFAFLRGQPSPAPLPVQRYFPLAPSAAATTLASFADGKPFLVQTPPQQTGNGRVFLSAASLDADATALPVSGVFVPMVQSAARYLCGGGQIQRNLPLGRTLSAHFDEPVEDKSLVLRRLLPDGTLVDMPRPHSLVVPSGWEVRCPPPPEPGTYLLQVHLSKSWMGTWFVVEAQSRPVDLSPLSPARFKTLQSQLGFIPLSPSRQEIADAQDSSRRGHPLWLWLLAAVLLLGLGELALSNWWNG